MGDGLRRQADGQQPFLWEPAPAPPHPVGGTRLLGGSEFCQDGGSTQFLWGPRRGSCSVTSCSSLCGIRRFLHLLLPGFSSAEWGSSASQSQGAYEGHRLCT